MTHTPNPKIKMAFNLVAGALMLTAFGIAGSGLISAHNTLSDEHDRLKAMTQDDIRAHYQKHCVSRETERQLEWYYTNKETVEAPVKIWVDPQDPLLAKCAQDTWEKQKAGQGMALAVTLICGVVGLFTALVGVGALAHTSYNKKRAASRNDMNGPQ